MLELDLSNKPGRDSGRLVATSPRLSFALFGYGRPRNRKLFWPGSSLARVGSVVSRNAVGPSKAPGRGFAGKSKRKTTYALDDVSPAQLPRGAPQENHKRQDVQDEPDGVDNTVQKIRVNWAI